MFNWENAIALDTMQAPYVFNWENAIALDIMQGNRASSRGEGKVSKCFLELRQKPGVYSRFMAGMSIRNWSLFSEIRTPV